MATQSPALVTKRLELFTQVVPGVRRVAVLRGLAPQTRELQALEGAARTLRVALHRVDVSGPPVFDTVLARLTPWQAQGLFVFGDVAHGPQRHLLATLALQYRLPTTCASRAYVAAGCLMSYGVSWRGRGQQIATYVDKILQGVRPVDLPVEQAMHFEFVLNRTTAQTLGLTLPPGVLFQADEVLP